MGRESKTGSWLYFFALKCILSVNLINKSFSKRFRYDGIGVTPPLAESF